jgi:tRNA(Ile)-lysidine synthase
MNVPLRQKTRPSLVRRVAGMVRKTKLFQQGDRILVAVSGGPDSIALLSVLRALAPSWNLSLWAVHFNYGFRGTESNEDARFVAHLCDRLEVTLVSEIIDLSEIRLSRRKRSLQEAAREARYTAMLRIGASLGANKIALGHTADDQAETLLMWMLRGSGAAGLSGIPPARDSLFIRPLLEVSRADVLAYLKAEDMAFREDSSNATPLYLRNRVRHELLPALKRFNPSIVPVLKRQAQILREEDGWLEQVTAEHLMHLMCEERSGDLLVDRDGLLILPVALQRRVLRALVRRTSGLTKGPTFGAVEAVLARVVHGRSGAALVVQGSQVSREYSRLRFRPSRLLTSGQSATPAEVPLPIPSMQCWPPTGQLIRTSLMHSGTYSQEEILTRSRNLAVFDADRLTPALVVRAWKPGDVFQPFGMGGRQKKLQDYFADIKLSRDERRQVPLVVAPEGILWVGGHRTDHRFRVTSETRRRLFVELFDPSDHKETA